MSQKDPFFRPWKLATSVAWPRLATFSQPSSQVVNTEYRVANLPLNWEKKVKSRVADAEKKSVPSSFRNSEEEEGGENFRTFDFGPLVILLDAWPS